MEHKARETRYRKGHRSNEAKTEYELPGLRMSVLRHRDKDGQPVLAFSTYKTESGALVSHASVASEVKSAGVIVQRFGVCADYSRRVILTKTRATAKAVEKQHAEALEMLPQVLEDVAQFYVAKIEKERRDFPTQCEE